MTTDPNDPEVDALMHEFSISDRALAAAMCRGSHAQGVAERAMRRRPERMAMLAPLSPDLEELARIFERAAGDGWMCPQARPRNMRPEAVKRQVDLGERIVHEVEGAGLTHLIEQVLREQPAVAPSLVVDRDHEIRACCRYAGLADLADGFIADASMSIDLVRAKLQRERVRQDEALGRIDPHRAHVENPQDEAAARAALEQAIEEANAQASP
jgi:hypothetical protein